MRASDPIEEQKEELESSPKTKLITDIMKQELFLTPSPDRTRMRSHRFSVDKSMLSKESARSVSRKRRDLVSESEVRGLERYNTPQRRHVRSPFTRVFHKDKVTRVVEGHLMPIRDTNAQE